MLVEITPSYHSTIQIKIRQLTIPDAQRPTKNQPPSWKSSSLSSVPLTDSSESSVLDILSETERKLNVSRNNTGLTFYYTNNEKTAVIPDAQRPTKNQPPS